MSYLPSADESTDWEPVAGASEAAPNTTPETLYYLEDSQDTVLALLNNDDQVALRYHYDAFGVATDAEKFDLNYPGPDNLFGYTGLGYDASSGLSYARARYFDSSIGRFISQDTYEGQLDNPLSLNLYTYVENNPLRYVDPTGHMKWTQIDDLGKGIYDALAGTVKGIFSFDTYKGLYDLGKALYNKTISLTELGKTVVGAAVEPYKYIVNNTKHVFGGKPTDKEVRKYGEKLGEVLLSFAGSAKAMNLIAKVAPSLSKMFNKINKATCNCFTAGTKVLTDEGEKNIEDIEVGDKVLAKDEFNPDGELAYKEVTALYTNYRNDIIKLYIGDLLIETTDNHPFWVEGRGWVFADELKVGDKLQKADGSNLTIDSVEFVLLDEPVMVYNFTVADYHTYYVTDLGIWVHNTWCFDAAAFEKKIANMSSNERVATVRSTASDIASQLKWTKDSKLTRINGRDVYYDSASGNYYALDTQHGRFEVVNKRGKHQGEVNFNLDPTKSADKKGGHDLKMK
ncbi:polymorphic toxin-type HINT domain-containing protein [Paenibacillus septentrionalis]